MKQNNLEILPGRLSLPENPCLGRIACTWGGFGLLVAWLWELAGARDALAGAVVWALALIAGLALAAGLWESHT